MTSAPTWRLALDRLIKAPLLTAHQVRFLAGDLDVPRDELLGALVERLTAAGHARDDVAFILDSILSAKDKPFVQAFVSSAAPLPVRALVRSLYQHGLLLGRLSDEEADLALPAGEEPSFYVEDVVRELEGMPSPWQRARVVAEALVADAPVPDDGLDRFIAAVAPRLHVDPAAVYAELLIHPLTRPVWREAAARLLEPPSHAAATQLELAGRALLPGPLLDVAVREAQRHRRDAPPAPWHARIGGADGRASFPLLLSTEGPLPRAIALVVGPDPALVRCYDGQGPGAESALVVGDRLAMERGPLVDVPVEFALSEARAAATWMAPSATAPAKGRKQKEPELPVHAAALATSLKRLPDELKLSGHITSPPPDQVVAAELDVAALDHSLAAQLGIAGSDLSDAVRRDFAREIRARGRVRDDTVNAVAAELARKAQPVARLASALLHDARVCLVVADHAGERLAALGRALAEPQKSTGVRVIAALLRRTLVSWERDAAQPPASTRDELREEILPPGPAPTGLDVLSLDLGAAALDAMLNTPGLADGLSDETLSQLCTEAGQRAALGVVRNESPSDETPLAEVARGVIKDLAPNLPSRQRRDIIEGWTRAWLELVSNACRSSCSQNCFAHLDKPRPMGAFALDHPRHNRPWPSG